MQITVQAKMMPNSQQAQLIAATTKEYIRLVNQIVTECIDTEAVAKYTSKNVFAEMPSAVKNQAIQDAKSVYRKYKKTGKQSILKKPIAVWNNQNYRIEDGQIVFPVFLNGKSKQLKILLSLTDYQTRLFNNKLGTLRISKKSGKFIAQIAVEATEIQIDAGMVMGVDLGLKIPAVAVVENGKTKFFGNGRQNKYFKRKYRSRRRKLGKLKKLTAIRKQHNKEQRWMKDQDHKTSRNIVNFAKENNVSIIRMEQLSDIRQTARTSRKNEKNLHTWSFYRLANFVEYKAKLMGMSVEYVNPKYTSQTCLLCGERNKANDRKYKCGCGFRTHRDILGAKNIINAPVADGNSLSA